MNVSAKYLATSDIRQTVYSESQQNCFADLFKEICGKMEQVAMADKATNWCTL